MANRTFLIKFGADSTSVTKAIRGINTGVRGAVSQANEAENAFKFNGDTSGVSSALKSLQRELDTTESASKQLKSQLSNGVESGEIAKDSTEYQRLSRAITTTDGQAAKLNNSMNRLKSVGTPNFSGFDAGSSKIGKATVAMGSFIGSFAGNVASSAISALGSAIKDLGGEAVSASDSLDKFKSTMSFAGFGTKEIDSVTKSARKYADETVYSLEDIVNTTAQLGANGVDNYSKLVEAGGNLNAVVGGNADTFKSVNMVLTQTAGTGKLTTENWNQMADAIPGASGKLQEAMKKNGAYTGNFRDAMEDGQISSDEFNKAIMQLGFTDVAQKAAKSTKTFEGAFGNLGASIQNLLLNPINAIKPQITDFVSWLASSMDGIPAKFSKAFSGVNLGDIGSKLMSAFQGLDFSGLTASFTQTFAGIKAGFDTFINAVSPALTPLITAFQNLWDNGLQPVFSAISTLIVPVFKVLGAYLGGVFSGIMNGVATVFNMLTPVLQVLAPVIQFMGSVFNTIAPFITKVAQFIGNLVGSTMVFNGVWKGLGSVIGAVGKWFGKVGASIAQTGASIGGTIGKIVGWFAGLPGKVMAGIGNISGKIGGAFGGVYRAITGAIGNVKSIGSNIVKGIWAGINGSIDWLKRQIGDFAKGVTKTIKGWFGIKSPSRVMRDQVGRYIAEGVGVGIEQNQDSAVQPMYAIKDAITGVGQTINPGISLNGSNGQTLTAGNITPSSNSVIFNITGNNPVAIGEQVRKILRQEDIITS